MSESDFRKLQKKVCDIPDKPLPLKKICPTCIPDENYIEPDWRRLVGESYLNEKTCEYMVCVSINKYGDSFVSSPQNPFPATNTRAARTNRRKLLRSYVEAGLRVILEDNGKLIANQILCASHNGPGLDFLPQEILTKYEDFDDAYFALSMDPASTGAGACREIDLPLAPALNPAEPINFLETIVKTKGRLPQITNPLALEIYAYPKKFAFVEGEGGLLKVLIAVPAYMIVRVPDNPIRDEIEAEAIRTEDEVILTVENLFGQIQRLRTALWVYSQYQSAFFQLQKGYLYQTEGEIKIDYYASTFSKQIQQLYGALKKLAKANGWNIKSRVKSAIRDNARLVKITFDSSDESSPYKILKIEAKKKGCPYEEWTKGIKKHLSDYNNNPTLWNYIAKLNEIDVALQARQSYPWLDFVIKYTFPLVHVDYGKFSKKKLEDQGLGCIADQAKEFMVELRDYMLNESLSIRDMVSYEWNSNSCSEFGDLSNEPEVKSFQEHKKSRREKLNASKKQGKEEQRKIDAKNRDMLTKERSALEGESLTIKNTIDNLDFKVKFVSPTEINNMFKQIETNNERIEQINRQIKQMEKKESRRVRKAGRQQILQDKEAGTIPDPYYKEAVELALEEFVTQDSLLASMVDTETFMESGKLSFKTIEKMELSDLTDRMSVCNLKSLTVQAVRCLMSGVTVESAFRKIVKASLEAMDLDVFGLFIQNLPAAEQQKLRKAFEKEFGNLPLPWEKGYDPGDISNTNAYIKYLKKPPAEEEIKEDPPPPEPEPVVEPPPAVPEEEIIEVPAPPPKVVYPTPEQLKTADESWAAYLENKPGAKKGILTKQKWYSLCTIIMNLPYPEKEKRFQQGITYQLDYNNWVAWFQHFEGDIKDNTGKAYAGSSGTQDLLDIQTNLWTKLKDKQEIDKLVEEMGEEDDAYFEQQAKEEAERLAQEMLEEDLAAYDQEIAEIAAAAEKAEAERAFEEDIVWSPAIVKTAQKIKQTKQSLKSKWKNLTEQERLQIIETEQSKDSKGGKQGTYGTALGNMQELVVQAYIEYMLDLVGIDELMKILDRFPGTEIAARFINDFRCAHQGMFKPPIKSFMSTLTLDVCDDIGIGIGFPEKVMEISGFFDSSPLIVLKKQFAGKIEGILTEVLKRIIVKVLQSLDSALCKSLNMAGQLTADLLSGKTYGLDDAFNEAFCPDADEEEKKKLKDNLFKSAGLRPNPSSNNLFEASGIEGSGVTDESYECVYRVINATCSKQEILSLLTESRSNLDPALLDKIAQLITTMCPEFSGVFGTPDQVGDVFGKIGNLIPPELRGTLRNQIDPEADTPIYDSICLTQPELDKWNEDRKNVYIGQGIDPKTAEDLVNDVNDKLGLDLDELAKALEGDPLGDALNSLLDPNRDPGCVVDETALVFEDATLRSEKTEMIKSLFENVERTFMNEIINGRFGILNNILRDKNNFRLKKHERRADMPFLFPNYTNSEEDWDFRLENSNKLVTARMKGVFTKNEGPLGNYPDTVGITMRDQLMSTTISYSTSDTSPQFNIEFIDTEEEPNYEFSMDYKLNHVNYPSKNIKVIETYHNRLSKKEAEKLGIDSSLFSRNNTPPVEALNIDIDSHFNADGYNNFNYSNYSAINSYQSLVFKSILESKVSATINDNGELLNTFDALNNKLLNFVKSAILTTPDGDIPSGFKFGYSSGAPITFEDLWYVNPDASPNDKSTWLYTHLPSEAVLGKSATENPRVHFLDPSIHGGSYLFPKIYVEPSTYNGWLGMVKTFIPEMELCSKVDNGFLNMTRIADRVKEVEDNLPFDERLSLAPDCRIEVPYDKQFSPATHGIMEGVVTTTMEVYATEFILKTLPVLSGIEMTENNFDSTLLDVLAEEFKKGLVSQTNNFNIVQGYSYYLLFLEQTAQVVQRQIKDGLMKETPEIKEAYAKIEKAQVNYNGFKIDLTNLKEFDWSIVEDTFRGAAIISFGEDWETDYQKILTDKIKDTLGLLIAGSLVSPPLAITALLTKLTFLTPFKIRLARKINSIEQTKEAAEVLMKALMAQEMSLLMKKLNLNLRPLPHIQNINKYLLSRNGITLGSSLRSGEMTVENPSVEGATGFDYGDVFNVVRDVNTENPLSELELVVGQGNLSIPQGYSSIVDYLKDDFPLTDLSTIPEFLANKVKNMISIFQNGLFYLEKYVRVFEKDGTDQIYNIKEFQERITNNPDIDPNSYISDNYGNAFIVADSVGGTIGVKFGVRLVYCPPPSFEYQIPSGAEKERTYKFATTEVAIKFDDSFYDAIDLLPEIIRSKIENVLDQMKITEESLSRAIPIAFYEQDILDRKMSEIDLEDKNMGEELKCYVDHLVETDDFKTIFELCFPNKTYTSLFAIYSYYGFFESIGKSEEGTEEKDEDPAKLREKWKKRVFKRTKRKLRRLFNSTYRTDDDVKEEREGRSKKEKSDFMKNLLPQTFLNLDSSVQWWQSIRFIDVKPFDADGKECLNAFQKMFR